MTLAKAKDGREGFIDTPLLIRADSAYHVAKSSSVNCAHLLDQDTGGLTEQLDLGSERCGLGAERSRGDQDDRAREQLVGLDDHSVPAAALLVTCSPWRAELVDVTPQHACPP